MTPEERAELEQRRAIKASQPVQSQGPSAMGALESLGQGLSMGFQDEMRAGVQSVLPGGLGYDNELDRVRRQQQQFSENNPILDTGLKLGGNLISGIATGGAGANMMAREAGLGALEGIGTNENGNIGMDAASGALLGSIASKFGSLFGRPSASERVASGIGEIAERAEQRAGRRLITRAQEADSAMGKRIEAMTETLPFASATKGIKEGFQDEITDAAARSIGLPGGALTQDALSKAKLDIGRQFDSAIKDKIIPISDDAVNGIVSIADEYQKLPGAGNQVRNMAEDLFNELDKPMTAARYQKLSSYFGKKLKAASKKGDFDQIEAIGGMKDTLDNMVASGLGGESLDQFQKARGLYKNFMALTGNRYVVDQASGGVNGKRLFNELAKQKKAYNVAGDELGDLATLSTISGVGDSGTASRLLLPLAGVGAAAGYGDLSGSLVGTIGATRVADELAQKLTTEGGSMLGGAIQRTQE